MEYSRIIEDFFSCEDCKFEESNHFFKYKNKMVNVIHYHNINLLSLFINSKNNYAIMAIYDKQANVVNFFDSLPFHYSYYEKEIKDLKQNIREFIAYAFGVIKIKEN